MPTETEIWNTLAGVIHPSFGLSLTVLKMVDAVRVSADSIEIDLVMNCPGCPSAEATLNQVRQRLAALDPQAQIRFQWLPREWQPPWGALM